MKGKRYYMKNIKRKLWILAIILCGYMGFGIKAYAAAEQWFAQQVEKLAKEEPEAVFTLDDVGCGIVPIDKKDRDYRETAGRIGCNLAAQAQRVIRVCCGIGQVIK